MNALAPPPPPPPPLAPTLASAPSPSALNALFAEIRNGGDSIATRLRHVPEYKKTYKQKLTHGAVDMSALERKKLEAEMRRHAATKEASQACPAVTAGGGGPPAEHPPRPLLENNKRWVVKSCVGDPGQPVNVVLSEASMQHVVCVQDCRYARVEVKGKVKSVSVSRCHKVQLVLSSVVATVEILGCTDTDVQVAETAPSVVVENSSVVNIYLLNPEHCRETDIFSTRISAVNVTFPSQEDPENMVERPLPEQFVSRIVSDGKKVDTLETKPNRH